MKRIIPGGADSRVFYEAQHKLIEATIILPLRRQKQHEEPVRPEAAKLLMPFASIELVESFEICEPDGTVTLAGKESMLVWERDAPESALSTCSKLVYTGGRDLDPRCIGMPVYTPSERLPTAAQGIIALIQFNEIRKRKDHGFVERPAPSRQVRRAEGFSETYREYVIIRANEPQYRYATPIREMVRHMRRKHKVSRHYRHYWRGVELERPILVREHVRNRQSEQELAPVYLVR